MKFLKCNHCQNLTSKPLFKVMDYASQEHFELVKCKRCDLVWTNPKPQGKNLDRYYQLKHPQERGRLFNQLIEVFVSLFRESRVRLLLSLKREGRILDVGCGRGLELKLMSQKGFESYGVERPWRQLLIRPSKKVKITFQELTRCRFPTGFFDLVSFWHSLEHLNDPSGALKEVKRILKNDGFLVIQVPNFGSLQARLFSGKWFHLDVPRHLYHFSSQTLKALLGKNGFKIKKISRFSLEYDIFGFGQSILNYLFPTRPNYLFDLIKVREPKKFGNNLLIRLLYLLISIPIFLASGLLAVIDSLFFGGGTITVIARKSI